MWAVTIPRIWPVLCVWPQTAILQQALAYTRGECEFNPPSSNLEEKEKKGKKLYMGNLEFNWSFL